MKYCVHSRSFIAAITLSLIAVILFCMPTEEEVRSKEGNLTNPTASFIYNAIPENEAATITQEYNTAINSFAVNLLHALSTSDSLLDKNLIISPLNINRNLAIVTAMGGTSAVGFEKIVFDRPFVYFIRAGENGLVLFAGIMNNPNQSS